MSTCAVTPEIILPASVEGRMVVAVQCGGAPVDGAHAASLVALVQGFFTLADRGAYTGANHHPVEGRCAVLQGQHGGPWFSWVLDVAALDGRAARVLFNALLAFSRLRHPINKLVMSADVSQGCMAFPLSWDEAMAESLYPGCAHIRSMEVLLGASGRPNAGRRCEVTFARPLDSALLAQVRQWLLLWAQVSFGSYAAGVDALASGEEAIMDAHCDIATLDSVELELGWFGAPPFAWHGLINLCERISADIAPVVRLDIQ